MTRVGLTRRQVLGMGTAAIAGGLSGCLTIDSDTQEEVVDLRGAIYLPARAFNTYQMWRWYDPAVTTRDLGFASEINLNALRIPLSYEFWKEDPMATATAIDHLLATATERGIRVMPALFDFVGMEPTWGTRLDRDPTTATAIQSPARAIRTNPWRWDEPRQFVRWFMDRYGSDNRLIAIEVMNEPGWSSWGKSFAQSMCRTATKQRGQVPLSVGSTSMAKNTEYVSWGIDVLQVHYNFPDTPEKYRTMLKQVMAMADKIPQPIWLTEWQRARPGRSAESHSEIEWWEPDYTSLVPATQETGIGNFFWSLMIKPAYLLVQRRQGVLSGIFHEDGTVWSAEDARAIKAMSGDDTGSFEERREWPAWALRAKEAFIDE